MSAINQINNDNDKGVVLLMVLSTIFIVVILANVVLTLITSQSRLTHHQVSRIQAYYAAQAGMNYALEQLRLGNWSAGNTYSVPFAADDFKPASIVGNTVSIAINQPQNTDSSQPCYNPPGNTACVSATASYTYTP